jgi:hypothetical protein
MATRLERVDGTDVMVPYLSGERIEWHNETYSGFLWRCEGCKLVWTRRHQAENCAQRNHAASYVDRYSYKLQGYETHGKCGTNEYTRRPVRRDVR